MALVIADRVRETTTTTGTGTITLAGPYTGFQAFSVIGNGNTTYYAIIDAATGAWEVGIGAYTTAGNTLSRTTILSSSNGGAAVNFGVGTKDVIITQPAARAVYLDTASNATIPGITLSGGTANGVAYLNASKVLTTGSALTFDGTHFRTTGSAGIGGAVFTGGIWFDEFASFKSGIFSDATKTQLGFQANSSEQMRLTSTGLGIGTSSITAKLTVSGNASISGQITSSSFYSNTTGYILGQGSEGVLFANATDVTLRTPASGNINFQQGDTTVGKFDSSGNLGLGVTPSAWNTNRLPIQFPHGAGIFGNKTFPYSSVFTNTFNNTSDVWTYVTSGEAASRYDQIAGQHRWFTAPSGTAGNAISFTQAMTLDASGNLGIGTTSPAYKLDVASSSGQSHVRINSAAANDANLLFAVGSTNKWAQYYEASSGALKFYDYTAAATRLTLDSSGNLGLGVTPSAWGSGYRVVDGYGGSALAFSGGGSPFLARNAYYNGTSWIYKSTAPASLFGLNANGNNEYAWFIAPSGAAGNAISFTQAMTLDASGNLLLGATSGSSRLVVGGSSGQVATPTAIEMDQTYRQSPPAFDKLKLYLFKGASESYGFGLGASADVQYWAGSSSTGIHAWYTSQTERARIDSSGNLIQSAPATPPTLSTNGTMVFNLTSNTNLRVSVRGSDGVTRTANITLA